MLRRLIRGLGLAAALLGSLAGAPLAAQDMPVAFLRAMALRDQPAGEALAAISRFADHAGLPDGQAARLRDLLEGATRALAQADESGANLQLAEARALLAGARWDERQAFASSLSVALPSPFVAQGDELVLTLVQRYQAPEVPARLRLTASSPSTGPLAIAELPVGPLPAGPLLPVAIPNALEGRGELVSEIVVDGAVLARSTHRVDFVPDLAALEQAAERRLAGVDASPEADALVRYPFDLARRIAGGEREMEARAFSDRLARSEQVLDALEQGRDIVLRATGDQDRAYVFAETAELIPYRIHVPSDWDGSESLPLVVALHGGGGDENEMMQVDSGKFGQLAERYRYIVVSPLGYRPLGAYGSPIRLPSVYGSDTQEGRAVGGAERAQLLARSERDVLEVLERTVREYGADRSRIFLTGHSMGGGGSWYLAHQHPHLWAGVAPSAGPFFIDGYDFDRLRTMGVMIVQGAGDPPSLDADRQLAIDLLARGIGVNYMETPSVNHGQTFGASLPTIFEFFERERLRERPDVPLELR